MPLNEHPMERSPPGPLLLKQWAKIAAIEEKEESAIRKLTKHIQAMHDLAKNATNIHKKLKEDLAIAMSELKKLTRAKEKSGAEKVAFRETLDRTLRQVVGGGNRPTMKRPASSPPTENRTRKMSTSSNREPIVRPELNNKSNQQLKEEVRQPNQQKDSEWEKGKRSKKKSKRKEKRDRQRVRGEGSE